MRQILEREGHTIEDATDGAQAIERYFINRPDVVFLDMVMEGTVGALAVASGTQHEGDRG